MTDQEAISLISEVQDRRDFYGLLHGIIHIQRLTYERLIKMATDQAALDASLTQVLTDLQGLSTASAQVLAKLQSVVPNQPAPDFTQEIAQLQTIHNNLAALQAADLSALTPTPDPVPTVTPTPAS